MHDELHWGMIGCGAVTETKSGPAFDRVEGSHLAAVASRTPGRAQNWASRHGTPRWFANPAELLADASLNAIYIATPPDAHAAWAIRAAKAGKQVLLVEKPLARSAAEARRIVDACREAGARLHVAYYRRTLPAFLQIKRWIDEGAIGDARAVALDLRRTVRPDESNRQQPPWRVRPEVGGGGHFADLAPHQFDFLDFVLGPVRDPGGDARNTGGFYAAEDTVDASWRHDGGATGGGSWRFCGTDGAHDRAVIAGVLGRIEFSFFDLRPGAVRLVTAAGTQEFVPPPQPHVHEPLIRSIVDEWRGGGTCPSTGASALRTDAVLDAILKR